MKESTKNLFSGKTPIRKKLIILYLLAAVLPILIITILISTIYYKSILENAYSLIEQNNHVNEILVQKQLSGYEETLYELVVDQDYINMAQKINESEDNTRIVAENSMKQMIQSSIYTYSDVRSITFIADNSRYASYSKWYSNIYDSSWSDARLRESIRQEIESTGKLTYIAPFNLSTDKNVQDYVVLLGFPVKNLHTRERFGVFVIALDNTFLMAGYEEEKDEKNAVTTLIVDQNNKILSSEDVEYIDYTLNYFKNNEFEKNDDVVLMEYEIGGTQWRIVNLIERSVYRQEIFKMLAIVILLIIVITFFFCTIVIYYTNGYIRNIQKITEGIQNYGEVPETGINIAMDEKDELYQIVRQFRSMTVRITSLIEELQQKNKDIQEASQRQKHAEIKALEAQINPHFLYNTLDSINWRAIENDEEEISNMLGKLGSLLRYSVSNIDMVVLMRAEIDWLEKYIYLQRDRFNNSFDCQYDFPEEVLNFPIYKMLLQPIVENVILHAFEDTRSGGMIYFNAGFMEDGRLRIAIQDNGSGMSPEVLEEIRKEIREKSALNSKSIGISNVINRMWIYYHDRAELYVNSVLGQGSEFILIIPDVEDRDFN